ncbi:u6 snRNA-associated sm-like protein lsm8 [Trichosporon asahii var. asahii CBS 2479]|uniref:LSM2-LSM8 complex subunit LSM8 n=1 Tax=Trichosporon asahii var. asahii (strain ATCC 90039 / CBS 2479 / JCM 2466 / KCTC 7840 / NBRC 103889/ NCYC 2677 / UAMH 7654) TaxID=1186058 RepID=J6EW32_TRIAS|nr:u6 snRNA-associated sm-like protein lsm8 [Trichosporon asahii var. asahii CBS 2479]EJT46997.1 u6 snRNA-associated sm-like protein lsm8 [Trichosporon asahii var. asahii CBS 2479]
MRYVPVTALAGFDHVVGQSLRRHENNNNRLDPTQPLNRRSELERPAFSDAPSAWPGYQQSKGRSQLGSRSGSRLSCLHSKDFVIVILYDGRIIVGRLKGNDNYCNLILSDSVEREYSADKGVEMISLGLYMIKGDNVALIAEVDEDKDGSLDYSEIMADPLPEIKY